MAEMLDVDMFTSNWSPLAQINNSGHHRGSFANMV